LGHHLRGWSHIYLFDDEFKVHIKNTPIVERQSLQAMAFKLQISESTAHHLAKEGDFKIHSSLIKPILTEENKLEQIGWCQNHADPDTG